MSAEVISNRLSRQQCYHQQVDRQQLSVNRGM